MSQPVYCSAPGDPHEADAIIGMVANGDQTMLCFTHLEDWCRSYLDAVADAEAAETAAETERRLAGVHPPAGSDQDQSTEPVNPLSNFGDSENDRMPWQQEERRTPDVLTPAESPDFPTSPASSPADEAAPEPPTKPADGRKRPGAVRTASRTAKAALEPSESATEDASSDD